MKPQVQFLINAASTYASVDAAAKVYNSLAEILSKSHPDRAQCYQEAAKALAKHCQKEAVQ